MTKENWEEIHESFRWCQKNWEKQNFTYQETKAWVEKTLTPYDYTFAYFLKKDGYQPTDLNENNLEELRKKVSWQDIHKDFSFRRRDDWEKEGFNHQEVKELMEADFVPYSYEEAKSWRKHGFNAQQVKEWKEALDCLYIADYFFCTWLKNDKQLTPQEVNANNRDKLREEYNSLWKDIHKDFDERLRVEWQRNNFDHQETKKWINIGFEPKESHVVMSWKEQGFNLQQVKQWTEIFRRKAHLAKRWIEADFTFEEAKQLIEAGFKQGDWQEAKKWKEKGFNSLQVQALIKAGLGIDEVEFADCIREKGYHLNASDFRRAIIEESWQNIHPSFDYSIRKEWEVRGFSTKQTQDWINAGLAPEDFDFATWLRDVKKVDAESVLSSKNEKELREEYRKSLKLSEELIEQIKKLGIYDSDGLYQGSTTEQESLIEKLVPNRELRKQCINFGLCQRCGQPNTCIGERSDSKLYNYPWCQPCNTQRFQANFKNWTSNNLTIDKLIQESQLEAFHTGRIFEWILHEQFTDNDNQEEKNWKNIHSNFTEELVQSWKNLKFNHMQTQEWVNIGLNPQDAEFAHFLKTQRNLTPEQVLKHHQAETLRQEFIQSQAQQAQILQSNQPYGTPGVQ